MAKWENKGGCWEIDKVTLDSANIALPDDTMHCNIVLAASNGDNFFSRSTDEEKQGLDDIMCHIIAQYICLH